MSAGGGPRESKALLAVLAWSLDEEHQGWLQAETDKLQSALREMREWFASGEKLQGANVPGSVYVRFRRGKFILALWRKGTYLRLYG